MPESGRRQRTHQEDEEGTDNLMSWQNLKEEDVGLGSEGKSRMA